MILAKSLNRTLLLAGASGFALAAATAKASAGGFAIGEQSTVFMGTASAGAAAGGSIGSMYWNPAATAQFSGINTESSYTLILPNADATVTSISPGGAGPFPVDSSSGDVGIDAVTSASYGTYQVSKDLWVGIGINSPFGLATKPENTSYLGSVLGVTTKLITVNANPTLAYKIAPGVTIGAGVQIEWARGKLQFDETGTGEIGQFKGTDWAFGATAGILIEPARGTSIGLGWRSGMSLDLDGNFHQPIIAPGSYSAVGSLDLPDLVTLSLRQDITSTTRLLGTVEWTNWSVFNNLTLKTVGVPGGTLAVPANWSDGWFFSLGGEYDYSPVLTLRSGVAYEISPEDAPDKRFTTIPDNDRVWLNLGASYKWSEATTFDIAYSHIFVKDGDFVRSAAADPTTVLAGSIEASCDLFSIGMRTRW